MARIIKIVKAEPVIIAVGGETKYVCGCGLSRTPPYCDGSHEVAALEDEGKLYWYDADGNCHEIADTFPDMLTSG
jgi:CDGSH-type Zn-finger protein